MPIEPVKIPQNVYVEDRIIGPITLRQIMIVMGSSGISYAIWAIMRQSGATSAVHTFFAWTPTMIGVAFAFVKINGISLLRILLLLAERLDKPARRVWTPREGIYVNIITKSSSKKNTDTTKKQNIKEESQIEELSRVLDQGPQEDVTPTQEVTDIEVNQSPKPVKKDRIQAERRKKPVDDIKQTPKDFPASPGGLMRDISPPPSHA